MNILNDTTILSNELNPKKKSRSLVSFFLDKQKNSIQQISNTNLNIKTMKNDSILQTYPSSSSIDIDLSQKKRDPTLTSYRGQSIKSPTYHDAQIRGKDDLIFDHHSYGYLQLFDEIINENTSCFGFSLSHITSKYCLYMTIILFLGSCLIISLTAIFKK